MTKDELAEKIFREIHSNGKPCEFGYREERGAFVWRTDSYDWKIVVCSEESALLYVRFRETNDLSMIRRYFFVGSLLQNESVGI